MATKNLFTVRRLDALIEAGKWRCWQVVFAVGTAKEQVIDTWPTKAEATLCAKQWNNYQGSFRDA